MKHLSARTINGRTTLLIILFLTVIVGFSLFLYIKNLQIRQDYLALQNHSNSIVANTARIHGKFPVAQVLLLEAVHKPIDAQQEYFRSTLTAIRDYISVVDRDFEQLNTVGHRPYLDSLSTDVALLDTLGTQFFAALRRDTTTSPESRIRYERSLYQQYFSEDMESVTQAFYQHLWTPINYYNKPYQKEILSRLDYNTTAILRITIIISLLSIAAVSLAWWYFRRSLNRSITPPVTIIQALASGQLPDRQTPSVDELGQITRAANQLTENLRKAVRFALNIEQGNFEDDYTPQSEDDVLGNSLWQMRDALRKYREEEQIRQWTSEGLSQVMELIRHRQSVMDELSEAVLSFLVKYLNVQQGGFFVVSKVSEPVLELSACYAFDRKKFLKKQIAPGEGLVGQAYLEKETALLTELPDNYVNITSGLGGSSPTCLLIVPVTHHEAVEAVVELGSWQPLTTHQVTFVEQAGELLASALSTLRTTEETRQLLAATQEQAKELQTREEEMRQNMEELEATQEELVRKNREIEQLYHQQISSSNPTAES